MNTTTIEQLKRVEQRLYDVAQPCLALATLFNQDSQEFEPDPGWMIGVSTILRRRSELGHEQISELSAVIRDLEHAAPAGTEPTV